MVEPRVLVLAQDELPPDLEALSRLCPIEVAEPGRLERQLSEHSILYIWDYFWDRDTDELRDAWPKQARVDWVHIANVGIDKVSFPELLSSIEFLSNAAGVYERPIAEYVLATYLFFAKRLRSIDSLQRERTWLRLESQLVARRKATVVGAGPIGREIASLLKAVGISVQLVGSKDRTDSDGTHIAASAQLTELLEVSDLLVLAAPLTDATRRMVGDAELRALGREGIVINVGRGELIDDEALVASLVSREIAGAVLDVFTEEPLPEESPYWALDNCLVTSHLSGVTDAWRSRLAAVFNSNLRRYLAGQPLKNVVYRRESMP